MDFNQRLMKLMELRDSGDIDDAALGASIKALYEERKKLEEEQNRELTFEEKRQQLIEANRKQAEENRRRIAEYENQHREEYRIAQEKKEYEDSITVATEFLRRVADKDGFRLYSDEALSNLSRLELLYLYDKTTSKMTQYEIEVIRKSNIVPEKIEEKKDHTSISFTKEQWEKYLSTLPGYTPKAGEPAEKELTEEEKEEIARKAEDQAKAAADERERQEAEAKAATTAAANAAASAGTVIPTVNPPSSTMGGTTGPSVNNGTAAPGTTGTTEPDKTTGAPGTTGTAPAGTTAPGTEAQKPLSDKLDPEVIRRDTTNQTGSKNPRKIKNVRGLYDDKEIKAFGGEVVRLAEARVLRLVLAGLIIGAATLIMFPVVPPLGALGTVIALPILLNKIRDEKIPGKFGKTLSSWVNADKFKAELTAKIKEAEAIEKAKAEDKREEQIKNAEASKVK